MELLNILGLTIGQFLLLFLFLCIYVLLCVILFNTVVTFISFNVGYKKLNKKLDDLSELYGVFEIEDLKKDLEDMKEEIL